ncbi:MAG: metallophosphoesterase family protein [Acidobacteriota bacterium]
MRIALLADVHGNIDALDAVIDDLTRREVSRVANLGDHASGPLAPLRATRLLMAQTSWIHLAGNHERQLLTTPRAAMNPSDAHAVSELGEAELAWMANQEPCAALGDDVLLCHGTPSSDSTYLLETVTEEGQVHLATRAEIHDRLGPTQARLIACGHSHIPRVVRTESGQLVVNPGSVGLPAYDDDRPTTHVMQVGSPDARYAVVERVGDAWRCELISVPYDATAMIELALANERSDWAEALTTGYLTSS